MSTQPDAQTADAVPAQAAQSQSAAAKSPAAASPSAVSKAAALARGAFTGMVPADDPYVDEPFGTLRGRSLIVRAEDGTELYTETDEPEGYPADGVTVIFSHGFQINQDSWHFQRKHLREAGVRAVYWDQRCHGRSRRGDPANSNIDQLGRDLAAVIAVTAPKGPIVLVGHSMGGMTIIALAAQHPELFGPRVKAALLCGTSAGGFNTVTFGMPAAFASFAHAHLSDVAGLIASRKELIQSLQSGSSQGSAAFTKLTQLGPKAPKSVAAFLASMMAKMPLDAMVEFLPAMEAYEHHDDLPALSAIKVTVLTGDRDTVLPQSHGRSIANSIDGAEFWVLDGVGHLAPLEAPAKVNNRLDDLVAKARR